MKKSTLREIIREEIKYFLIEEDDLSDQRIGTYLDKQLKKIDNTIKRRSKRSWGRTLVPGKGISTTADDWSTDLSIYLIDGIIEVEISMVGTDKRGRTDADLLYRKEIKITSKEDYEKIDKLVNILKVKIKKFSK